MADKSESNVILDSIINSFKAQYTGYTIRDYDEIDGDDGITTPAIFIQMLNFESANNPIREVFRVNATFRAYICESYRKTEDEFNEKITSCEVWYAEWEQQLYSNSIVV